MSDESPNFGRKHLKIGYAVAVTLLLGLGEFVWQVASFKADLMRKMEDNHKDCVSLYEACWWVSDANEQYHQWRISSNHDLPSPSEVMRVTRQQMEWAPTAQSSPNRP